MSTAVERAAEVLTQRATWPSLHWGMDAKLHPEAALAFAHALADAGLLADGDSETRVEYGVRVGSYTHPADSLEQAIQMRDNPQSNWTHAITRTVTTSEWKDIDHA